MPSPRPNIVAERLARNGYVYPAVPCGLEFRHVDAAVRLVCSTSRWFGQEFGSVLSYADFDLYTRQTRRPLPSRSETLEAYLCKLNDWREGWKCNGDFELLVSARSYLVKWRAADLGLAYSEHDRRAIEQASSVETTLQVLGYNQEVGIRDFVSDSDHVMQWITAGAWRRCGYTEQMCDNLDLLALEAAEYVRSYGCAAWRLLVELSRSVHTARFARRVFEDAQPRTERVVA